MMHGLQSDGGLTAISVENNGKSNTLTMWKKLTLQGAATILSTAININLAFRPHTVFMRMRVTQFSEAAVIIPQNGATDWSSQWRRGVIIHWKEMNF